MIYNVLLFLCYTLAHSCGINPMTSGITTNTIRSVTFECIGGDPGLHPSASSQLCRQPSTYLELYETE